MHIYSGYFYPCVQSNFNHRDKVIPIFIRTYKLSIILLYNLLDIIVLL